MFSREGEEQLLRMGPCRGSGFEMGLGVGETEKLLFCMQTNAGSPQCLDINLVF